MQPVTVDRMAAAGWPIRVEKPELLARIEELAAERGETPAELITEALERFIEENP